MSLYEKWHNKVKYLEKKDWCSEDFFNLCLSEDINFMTMLCTEKFVDWSTSLVKTFSLGLIHISQLILHFYLRRINLTSIISQCQNQEQISLIVDLWGEKRKNITEVTTTDIYFYNEGLFGACKIGSISSIKLFLSLGANKFNECFDNVCKTGDLELVKMFLTEADNYYKKIKGNGITVRSRLNISFGFRVALLCEYENIVNYLLNLVKETKDKKESYHKNESLFCERLNIYRYICEAGRLDLLKELEIEEFSLEACYGLCGAVEYGRIEIVKYIIIEKYKNKYVQYADEIDNAFIKGQIDLIKFLMNKDYKLNNQHNFKNACISGSLECIEYMINYDKSIIYDNLLKDLSKRDCTPEVIMFLINSGAKLDDIKLFPEKYKGCFMLNNPYEKTGKFIA
jgi:hypothetical protein